MKRIFFLLVIVLLNACSSKDHFINPDYSGKKIEKASLIIPTLKEFKITQDENLFSEEELMAINKKFVDEIGSKLLNEISLKSTFKKIDFVELENRIGKEKTKLNYTNGETIHFDLPVKPLKFSENGKHEIYILFFDQLSLSIFKKQRETSDPAKHYTATTPAPTETRLTPAKLTDQVFSCEIKYVIYDNQLGMPVTYGIKSFDEKITENSDLDKLVGRFVEKIAAYIIKDTPFEK